LVLVNQPLGYLVQEIFPAIGNPGMDTGNTVLLHSASIGVFVPVTQAALGHFQLTGVAISIFSCA
jgi:hypothetical protein